MGVKMSDLGHLLYVKYGLSERPTEQKIQQWVSATNHRINMGMDREQAGNMSAREIFPTYQTCLYDSVSDSIETLLIAARERARSGR